MHVQNKKYVNFVFISHLTLRFKLILIKQCQIARPIKNNVRFPSPVTKTRTNTVPTTLEKNIAAFSRQPGKTFLISLSSSHSKVWDLSSGLDAIVFVSPFNLVYFEVKGVKFSLV